MDIDYTIRWAAGESILNITGIILMVRHQSWMDLLLNGQKHTKSINQLMGWL